MLALGLAGALGACLEDPEREQGQWPISRAELAAHASKNEAAGAASDAGEAAYRKTCIACHGADGRGHGGKTAADLTAPGGVLQKPDAALLASIRDGATGPIGVMPPHRALLTDDELAAVLGYVRRTFGPGITPDPGASPDAASATGEAPATATAPAEAEPPAARR